MPNLEEVIRSSPVVLHADRYAYLRASAAPPVGEHFFVCADEHEITVVTREALVDRVPHDAIEARYRLLEFQISVPFQAPGFLATISSALADAGMNVLIVSTFGRDYVLLREADVKLGLQAIKQLGFTVRER